MKNQNTTIERNETQNQTIIFKPVAPHPEPAVIGELLTEIEAVIKRHVVLSDAAATALAVWVLHTYVYELRDTVGYVAIESPEKRCGKTTLLSVLAAMANKPLIASNVTVGALFRAIDTCRPTLFINEADTFLAGSGTMRGIINSGNTWRTAYVLRLSKSNSPKSRARLPRHSDATAREQAEPENGDNSSSPLPHGHGSADTGLKRYSCWCPKVIAMIGKVPDTIADRSIVVPMVRKLVTEIRAPLAELDPAIIKAKCARFALDERPKIAGHEKIRGDGLNDRAADTFDPLYVIARFAGEQWEQKLHMAALAICPGAQAKSIAAELLLDMHTLFFLMKEKKMFTRRVIALLQDEQFTMGSKVLKDSAIDEYKIAQLLRPYGIKPTTFRIGKEVNKGYVSEDFSEALARYVPKADVEARMKEIKRQGNLWDEVQEEKKAERHLVPMG
jgi:putative DNA primase/helicase